MKMPRLRIPKKHRSQRSYGSDNHTPDAEGDPPKPLYPDNPDPIVNADSTRVMFPPAPRLSKDSTKQRNNLPPSPVIDPNITNSASTTATVSSATTTGAVTFERPPARFAVPVVNNVHTFSSRVTHSTTNSQSILTNDIDVVTTNIAILKQSSGGNEDDEPSIVTKTTTTLPVTSPLPQFQTQPEEPPQEEQPSSQSSDQTEEQSQQRIERRVANALERKLTPHQQQRVLDDVIAISSNQLQEESAAASAAIPKIGAQPRPSTVSTSNSATTSNKSVWRGTSGKSRKKRQLIADTATNFRRLLRERVYTLTRTRTSGGASSTTIDDVPEPSVADGADETVVSSDLILETSAQADETIKTFVASRRGSMDRSREGNRRRNGNDDRNNFDDDDDDDYDDDDDDLKKGEYRFSKNVPRMPSEIPGGQPCNDGVVRFTVPKGWMATRSMDSFCLSNGLSLGFVRAVDAALAADALLETDRLQVMSRVSAVSSPTFADEVHAVVNYSCHLGAGKGVAKFNEDFDGGACVFGMCGPIDDQEMIHEGIEELKKSAECLISSSNGKDKNSLLGDDDPSTSTSSNQNGSSSKMALMNSSSNGDSDEHDDKKGSGVSAGDGGCVVQ